MGNACSKSSNTADPFARPGRVLGAAPPPAEAPRAPVKQKINPPPSNMGTGRALGGGGGSSEARNAAARAAEERASKLAATSGKGKLSSKLAAQKAQTRRDTLEEVSRQERGARNADAAEEARRWD